MIGETDGQQLWEAAISFAEESEQSQEEVNEDSAGPATNCLSMPGVSRFPLVQTSSQNWELN